MIIMINGAFGVGKTTICNELLIEINNSMLFDPEEVGFMLRNIIPEEVKRLEAETGDFQDLQLWKELTVKVAKLLITKYNVNLIVPMTIRKPEYFNYILTGFKSVDKQTYHFCLTASKETIYKRLRKRGEEEGNWCFQQTEKCIEAYKEYNFGEYIDTENVSITAIIENIKDKLNLS
ncbi:MULTISPECIES: AAA family ATPase [Metabacillus]|uniref:AAA family ATPase n=1 Tax=Metabacillus hrfriensis TaxID=3048891 RepID=A0ACD4RDU2_9BACI|nr:MULTISPECIES: AAA family ATPase [Metabacillus]UAL53104.1 AAA family ATPase [Metabacillus dongyingensis]UOK58664.1 AAA family ATPase [Bacillus sp. OVS6]USK29429.1 AAA family ATPase [Bacillus sp. CMF21]WHZ58654.1 AAA family ATPase [Metabacillus sp. CT-WN-B3]